MRYTNENKKKLNGVVYTPKPLADYISSEMLKYSQIDFDKCSVIRLLDPAAGSGELLISIINKIRDISKTVQVQVIGYEIDKDVAIETENRIKKLFPNVSVKIIAQDFLEHATNLRQKFEFIIANPPYIRTQILGTKKAQQIAQQFNLTGRIDIYYAFLIYMKQMLSDIGIAGYITSNKFLTIKSGASVRQYMINNYKIHSIFDFGDTKLFSASVLPCTIVFSLGKVVDYNQVCFSSIYEIREKKEKHVTIGNSIFDFVGKNGIYQIKNGKQFKFQNGVLQRKGVENLWVISSNEKEHWLRKVESNTWMSFADIGKIRVGIKTTADNVFIGNDWKDKKENLEWLRPLITHRDSGKIVSTSESCWKVLYTHSSFKGKKIVLNIDEYPKTKAYLEQHYDQLSARKYIQNAHRRWYEIWVPQNPESWSHRKIVFRDISEHPEFWLDDSGAVVNGDCYWIDIDSTIFENIIYLALAVANSRFIEEFYDAKFNNKLYSGKRRYMAQYVEQFPIPFMDTEYAQKAISIVKDIILHKNNEYTSQKMTELDTIVYNMFMLS